MGDGLLFLLAYVYLCCRSLYVGVFGAFCASLDLMLSAATEVLRTNAGLGSSALWFLTGVCLSSIFLFCMCDSWFCSILAVGTGDIWLFLGTDDPNFTVCGDTVLLLPGRVFEKLPCLAVVLSGIFS